MDFYEIQKYHELVQTEVETAIHGLFRSGEYIGGPYVRRFEQSFADFLGASHVIGCSSGTDALLASLLCYDVGPGDEIIVPDFTFFATAEAVFLTGATPIPADIEAASYTIDPIKVIPLINEKTKGIIAVSLFGHPPDFDALLDICNTNNLFLLEDAAQATGAIYHNRKSGSIADITTFSFYPTKPLHCYGDGGAIATDNTTFAEKIRTIINHGQTAPHRHTCKGMNGRLDAMQAEIVRIKLHYFPEELEIRKRSARLYSDMLLGLITTPREAAGVVSSWSLYTVRSRHRSRIIEVLENNSVPVKIYYPYSIHEQPLLSSICRHRSDLVESAKAVGEVFSLPLHRFLTECDIKYITTLIRSAVEQ